MDAQELLAYCPWMVIFLRNYMQSLAHDRLESELISFEH